MNKKKHQGDRGEIADGNASSTESCDENDNNKIIECPHINKSIDFAKIRKVISKNGLAKECPQCKESSSASSSSTLQQDIHNDNDFDYDGYECDLSLWLCLRCANEGCGRNHNQHALLHYKRPHSDSHALCVNTTDWRIWCYECDYVVNATAKKKLLEVFDYLKKTSKNRNDNDSMKTSETPVMDVVVYSPTNSTGTIPKISSSSLSLTISPPPPPSSSSLTTSLPRPRGLMNLGNTCFFNSVVQCLAQTPYLLNLLEETSKPGQYFQLPGGKLDPNDSESPILEQLDGNLECWKPLTRSLAETLSEIQQNNGGGRTYHEPYVPRLLLTKLIARMPQFGGGDQHDSHELLRHLLEAVREEDLRRYQSVILEKLGFNTKTDPSTVEGDKKKIVKFYGQQASELLLPTEQVFRGTLVSILHCQDCQHISRRDEYFLDLSLPIVEQRHRQQLPPILRRNKFDDNNDNSNIDNNSGSNNNNNNNNKQPSKHQIKKERRAERKKCKRNCHRQNNQQRSISDVNMENSDNDDDDDDDNDDNNDNNTESDADIEDNIDDNNQMKTAGIESGYNSDNNKNQSSPDLNNHYIDDSGIPSVSHNTPDNSPASSETNIDMGGGGGGGGRSSPSRDHHHHHHPQIDAEFDRPESRLSFVNKTTVDQMDLSKLSLLPPENVEKMDHDDDGGSGGGGIDEEGACGVSVEAVEEEKMEEDNVDDDLWTDTLSPRYQCEDGELSVQSCLNQFTSCELLTGNNKVCCDVCTKRYGGGGNGGKTVYTNTTKQLLIYNPPAVLILHLKRFQVFRFRSTKVSKFVKFPTILDLAPFCTKRSQQLPTFNNRQTKVLYSLYGIVEHSGSIHGGHYVAYVKVRPKLDLDDEKTNYRWQFLPKNHQKSLKYAITTDNPDIPQGKWYYISDSHVSEVSETKVLDAQAYLLFYERIL